MNKSRAAQIFLVLAVSFILSLPCEAEEKKILRFGAINMKSTLDMQLNSFSRVMDVSDAIVEPLLRLDEENKVVPVLLKSMPRIQADVTVYRFELKPGIKFHDGSTLKASDVKYTIERMFRPETKAETSYICDMIVGARDMLEGRADSLEGFKIIDDLNFEIR
jgi:peptide/nickel transport system substrate-binding protein